MSLWSTHRIFIGAVIVLCLVYAVHEGRAFAAGNVFALVRAIAAGVGATALAIYLRKLWSRGRAGPS